MGIRNSYDIFNECGKNAYIDQFSNKTICIDMMTYVVRIYKIYGPDKWYNKIINFIEKIKKRNIKCICVFDGFNKPPEKGTCVKKRKDTTNKYKQELNEISDEMKSEQNAERYNFLNKKLEKAKLNSLYPSTSELFNVMILIEVVCKCEVLIAHGEAESLCCYLMNQNQADYVMSEDSDVLLYNVDVFLTKYTSETGKLKVFTTSEILLKYQITFEELFYICLLMGTDYNLGLNGYGFKTGVKKIKQVGIQSLTESLDSTQSVKCSRLKEIFTPCAIFDKLVFTESEKQNALNQLFHRQITK